MGGKGDDVHIAQIRPPHRRFGGGTAQKHIARHGPRQLRQPPQFARGAGQRGQPGHRADLLEHTATDIGTVRHQPRGRIAVGIGEHRIAKAHEGTARATQIRLVHLAPQRPQA